LALIVILALAPAGAADAKRRHHHKRGHHHTRRHAAKPAPKSDPAKPDPAKPVKFDGSCDFSGTVAFTPAMTSTPQPTVQHALAPGICTGTFVDGQGSTSTLDKAPVIYAAESSGSISCLDGTATGAGRLLFPGGSLAFNFSETRLVATPLLRLTGKAGGELDGFAAPSQSQDPAASVQDCNGSGMKSFALDMHFQATSPISG
jgi:hypothetical protein